LPSTPNAVLLLETKAAPGRATTTPKKAVVDVDIHGADDNRLIP
jgi:hypothetical protein